MADTLTAYVLGNILGLERVFHMEQLEKDPLFLAKTGKELMAVSPLKTVIDYMRMDSGFNGSLSKFGSNIKALYFVV